MYFHNNTKSQLTCSIELIRFPAKTEFIIIQGLLFLQHSTCCEWIIANCFSYIQILYPSIAYWFIIYGKSEMAIVYIYNPPGLKHYGTGLGDQGNNSSYPVQCTSTIDVWQVRGSSIIPYANEVIIEQITSIYHQLFITKAHSNDLLYASHISQVKGLFDSGT